MLKFFIFYTIFCLAIYIVCAKANGEDVDFFTLFDMGGGFFVGNKGHTTETDKLKKVVVIMYVLGLILAYVLFEYVGVESVYG